MFRRSEVAQTSVTELSLASSAIERLQTISQGLQGVFDRCHFLVQEQEDGQVSQDEVGILSKALDSILDVSESPKIVLESFQGAYVAAHPDELPAVELVATEMDSLVC